MNERLVDIQIDIRGTVPWWIVPQLFEGATKLTPEDGMLAFTIDGDVEQSPVRTDGDVGQSEREGNFERANHTNGSPDA